MWRRVLWWWNREEEEDLEEEFQAHLAIDARERRESGLDPREADFAARRAFGNRTLLAEEARDVWRFIWLDELWRDVRYSLRQLTRSRGFTAVALLSLALGIGANTAIFSLVNAVVLRDLPFKDPERVFVITEQTPTGWNLPQVSSFDFLRAATQKPESAFESVVGYIPGGRPGSMIGPSGPDNVMVAALSAEILPLLGVQPVLGRSFLLEETEIGAEQSVILSNDLWRTRFAADPDVVGQFIQVNSEPASVVGVMPPQFGVSPTQPDMWQPLRLEHSGSGRTAVIARLKRDVTEESARQELNRISVQLRDAFPETHKNRRLLLGSVLDYTLQGSHHSLYALWVAIGLIFLIACSNVSGMMLARVAARRQEIGARLALGSSRSRLTRMLLTESAILATGGMLLGFLLAYWGTNVLVTFEPIATLPRITEANLDQGTLFYTSILTLLACLMCGWAPAMWSSKRNPGELLKSAGAAPKNQRTRAALILSQVALSLVLLVGAGLSLSSFLKLHNVNPGYDLENLFAANIQIHEAERFGESIEIQGKPATRIDPRLNQEYREILQAIRDLPGVTGAESVTTFPLSGYTYFTYIRAGGKDIEPAVTFRAVSEGYLQAMGIPLVEGRYFTSQDRAGSQWVAIVNESMARTYWPGEDPVGKTLEVRADYGVVYGERPRTVVGVVSDIRDEKLWPKTGDRKDEMFVPFEQQSEIIAGRLFQGLMRTKMTYVLRTAGNPEELRSAVKDAVAQVDPLQPVEVLQPQTYYETATRTSRSYMFLVLCLAAVAVFLAVMGIVGSIGYSVNRRIPEIGIRIALGARSGHILRIAMGREIWLTIAGVALGLLLAVGLAPQAFYDAGSRQWNGQPIPLYGVEATDPVTLLLVSALLIAVALAASYLPARRATHVDPMTALRCE